jgi:hypothetical protein
MKDIMCDPRLTFCRRREGQKVEVPSEDETTKEWKQNGKKKKKKGFFLSDAKCATVFFRLVKRLKRKPLCKTRP